MLSTEVTAHVVTKNLGIIVRDDRMFDTEIQKFIRIVNGAFKKLSKVLRDMKLSLKINKRILKCYIIIST